MTERKNKVQTIHPLSISRQCRLMSLHRSSYYYQMEGLIISLLKNLSNIDFKEKEKELNEVISNLSKLIGEDDSHIKSALRLAN